MPKPHIHYTEKKNYYFELMKAKNLKRNQPKSKSAAEAAYNLKRINACLETIVQLQKLGPDHASPYANEIWFKEHKEPSTGRGGKWRTAFSRYMSW